MNLKSGAVIATILSLSVSLFQACKYISNPVLNSFQSVNQGLEVSNFIGLSFNDSLYNFIEKNKGKNAGIYQSSLQLRQTCKTHVAYIETLKDKVIKQAGGLDSITGDIIKRDDIEIPTIFFVSKGYGDTLFIKREEVEKAFLELCSNDSSRAEIENCFKLPFRTEGTKNLSEVTFNHIPVVAALTILNKFENDCTVGEKIVLKCMANKMH